MPLSFNWIGLVAALATFGGVWIGHVSVRKIDSLSPTVWLPSMIAFVLGLSLEVGALSSENPYLSAALGILGITALWDALEFWRQHRRVAKGHAPANPENPRHRRLLAEYSQATTVDQLKRDPTGRQISVHELLPVQEVRR
jgi:hypothetical protein